MSDITPQLLSDGSWHVPYCIVLDSDKSFLPASVLPNDMINVPNYEAHAI